MARYVTVATVSHRWGGSGWPARPYTDTAGRLADAERFAVRARRLGVDVVAFPEIYPIFDAPRDVVPGLAEPIDGPTISHMAGVARREGMYVLWCTYRRDEEGLHNSAILLDRQGSVAGIYDKMYPTIWEIDYGVIPGREPAAIETDFGRVGVVICYDLNFYRECVEPTARAGAEIIFYPSFPRGGLLLRAYAHQLGVYFASAVLNDLGQIVDQGGDVLAESTNEAVAVARINLDRRMLHLDFNREKCEAALAKYGTGISLKYHTREGKIILGSEMPDVTVEDLMREFDLESLDGYLSRAKAYRDDALASAAGRAR